MNQSSGGGSFIACQVKIIIIKLYCKESNLKLKFFLSNKLIVINQLNKNNLKR